MVKILGIVGSPRKDGNTEMVIKTVLESAKTEGADIELLHLSDFHLEPCDGCWTCLKTKVCVKTDDIEKLFEAMIKADGIVLGSPVYFATVPSQVIALIDRVGALDNARGHAAPHGMTGNFVNKVGGAVTVARRTGMINAWTQILLFLMRSGMIISSGARVICIGREKGDVINDKEGIDEAKLLGCRITQIAHLTEPLRQKRLP
ncbi:MAG: flavodoxin family protein [Candidatus Bathyarchaeota archaeon]